MKKIIMSVIILLLLLPGLSIGEDKDSGVYVPSSQLEAIEKISKAEKIFQEKVSVLAKRVGQECIKPDSKEKAYVTIVVGSDCNYDMMGLIFGVLDYMDKKTEPLKNLKFFEDGDNLKLYMMKDNGRWIE